MKRKSLIAAVLLASCCGCSTMTHTDKGVLTGGTLGAIGGAALGSTVGKAGTGAALGGVLGAIGGGLTGNAVDRAEHRAAVAAVAANQPPPLGLQEIAQMSQNRVSDDVILGAIRERGAVYRLTSDELIYLKQQGVSDRVVREMQSPRPRAVYAPAPVRPVYVIEPPPPPPVIGFGVEFGHGGPRRGW